MSGCGTRIVLRFAVSATGGAHLCSIQYYLRCWLGICRTSLAVSALRIMRYCLISICAPCCICLEQNSAAGGVCVCAGKPTMTGSSACL
ncbi:MAG: hypothetical protein MR715_00630 [Subdoligranulum sp.]|nr:hypothetical protein [Subdoligranulum sp.]